MSDDTCCGSLSDDSLVGGECDDDVVAALVAVAMELFNVIAFGAGVISTSDLFWDRNESMSVEV